MFPVTEADRPIGRGWATTLPSLWLELSGALARFPLLAPTGRRGD